MCSARAAASLFPTLNALAMVVSAAALSASWACATQAAGHTSASGPQAQSIPLIVSETSPGHHRVEVGIRLGNGDTTCLLDTGAPKTTLTASALTLRYQALQTSESKGVAGIGTACDEVLVDELQLGGRRLLKFPASRCAGDGTRNLLGLDALGDRFLVDLRHRVLTLDPPLPQAGLALPLRRLRGGHMTLPARLGDTDVHVLFDTGADTTVVDTAFVAAHPGLFTLVRSEDGRDATGQTIPSDIHTVSSVVMGELHLRDVEVATFAFTEPMRRDMGADTPVILGTNVIEAAAWSFDLQAARWSVQKH